MRYEAMHTPKRFFSQSSISNFIGVSAFMLTICTALNVTAAPGSSLKPLHFSDIKGRSYDSKALSAHKATVFLFTSSQCPISNVYAPRFQALADIYGKKDVQVFAVYSDRQEGLAEITKNAKDHSLSFPVIKDGNNQLADILGAVTTPEAVVVDAKGEVKYRGRIDDNPVATRVSVHDLNHALDAVLANKPVAHPEMLAVGCAIRRAAHPVAAVKGSPTYAKDVAPILRSKCEGCHRPGEVAPFSLQTFEQASAWSVDIKRYTQNHQMPPWKPTPGYGDFQEESTINLSDGERATLAKWVDAGSPLGRAKDIPPPAQFSSGWKLGEPDMVIEPPKDYHLAADGDDVYRHFVINPNFTEDRYLSAVEVKPGNRAVVHHVIGYIDGTPVNGVYASEKLDGKDKDGQPGYTSFGGPGFVPTGIMGGWAPGNEAHLLPDGLGIYIPKGARIALEVHYHKDGKTETDRTKLGLHFCRSTVDKQVAGLFVLNFGFQIPPGASHHEVKATSIVQKDSHIFSVTPHMHLIGREMKVWATLPDGTEKPLVWIKDWDFNWQNSYFLKEPLAVPKGTKISLVSYYDNSSDNPRNPKQNLTRTIGWGEQTTDEMCVALISATTDAEHLGITPSVQKTAKK